MYLSSGLCHWNVKCGLWILFDSSIDEMGLLRDDVELTSWSDLRIIGGSECSDLSISRVGWLGWDCPLMMGELLGVCGTWGLNGGNCGPVGILCIVGYWDNWGQFCDCWVVVKLLASDTTAKCCGSVAGGNAGLMGRCELGGRGYGLVDGALNLKLDYILHL